MGVVRISERVSAPLSACRVDEEAGTIGGVLLCGRTSKNNREYPPEVHARDIGKYEDAKVFFNHSRNGRTFEEWVGVVKGAAISEDRPRGRLELFKSDPRVPKLLEVARKCPDKFGMSHVAVCRTRRGPGGTEVVESIESVESVDIVLDPATTRGLFEGVGAVEITLGMVLESVEKTLTGDALKRHRRVLVEMDGDPLMDVPVEAPADGLGADDAKAAALRSAGMAVMDDDAMEDGEKLKQLRAIFKLKKQLSGEKADDAPADDKPAETPESVRLKAENDRLVRENIDLAAKAAGVALDDVRRGVLAKVTESERKTLLESWQPRGGERPRSAGRTTAAELLGKTSAVSESATPDAKAFAASIRN